MLERALIDRSSETSEAPNYVKAACGLAFGLMMTSGPLFPDLVARLPRRIPKWILALRMQTGRVALTGSGRFSLAKLSGWLRTECFGGDHRSGGTRTNGLGSAAHRSAAARPARVKKRGSRSGCFGRHWK